MVELDFIDEPIFNHGGKLNRNLKYISLFSGIGGFEVAIHKVFPKAECIGYSEIKPSAIKVYKEHYPNHRNLGNITQITDKDIYDLVKEGCDLIVGGFPCTNLSSMANISGDDSGLEGPKSGLLYDMLRFLRIAKPKYFIAENNFSMRKSNRKIISELFNKIFPNVYLTMLDSSDFGVQTRKRLFWTNFPVQDFPKKCIQTWEDVLEPWEIVQNYIISDNRIKGLNKPFNTKQKNNGKIANKVGNKWEFQIIDNHNSKWDKGMISDTMKEQKYLPYPIGKSRPILAINGGSNNLIIDRRCLGERFIVRQLTPLECERLFNFPDHYTEPAKYKTTRLDLLGNSVVINVIFYLLSSL